MIALVRRLVRTVNAPHPAQAGRRDGLAYSLWLPGGRARGGVVILHGAGSCKESHHDYARVLIGAGLAAVTFDQRGHGESDGPMDERVLQDVASMAQLLREACGPEPPIALRGSSMGGCLAILAARGVGARALVAICPASGEGLRRGLRAGTLSFDADGASLDSFFAAHELHTEVATLDIPILLLHAAGDEQVPVEHSRELAKGLQSPYSRLIVLPGGHHRSIQHDPEMQSVSVQFIARTLGVQNPR
jgi:alpha-beta hydrolase superfamily lysophospholipase